MAQIVLLHGGGHRAWHWHLVRPILEQQGHTTLAPELPMQDPSVGAADWADLVVNDLAGSSPQDTIVVAHSMAGLVLPVIASRVAIRRMVFLCSDVPVPRVAYSDYLARHPQATIIPRERLEYDEQGRIILSWDYAREFFYHDCDEALAREAYTHLTPVATTGFTEPCPIDEWPDIPSTYIVAADDRVHGPQWSREVSIARLGGPARELPGSHSPFLSRPEQLASLLGEIATLDRPTVGRQTKARV